ncbi:membrane protein [Pseudoalteromonas rubra]|uniref:Membrane protein n=1 Tax=Pseudoalteromonas rubra TaxID=43658 RepID=A0A0F4QIH9_9GAMM|nr:membrane protein [Pseudoalteromonas rubra]KJZ07421.1 membrane protein [Pseudoalteromonas rubra]
MFITVIILLIVALIVIAVWVSAIQQHREKQEAERRKELSKQKRIIEEAEDVILNSSNIPMSGAMIRIIQRRVHDALVSMVELSPTSRELKSRMHESQERLNSEPQNVNESDKVSLPDNDKQLIALVQGIKKLRHLLRSEHSKGKVDTQVFVQEDRKMERLQLMINVESQIKRGLSAKSANMVGSARQYFEKAYAIICGVTYSDDYVNEKKNLLEGYLSEISTELKASNASAVKKKAEKEKDDLDVLFAPKKKW